MVEHILKGPTMEEYGLSVEIKVIVDNIQYMIDGGAYGGKRIWVNV